MSTESKPDMHKPPPLPRKDAESTPPDGIPFELRPVDRATAELLLEGQSQIRASLAAISKRASEERRLVSESIERVEVGLMREVGLLRHAVSAIDERVGRPPGGIDLRDSSVHDMTAEQVADLERRGSGLFRLVGQLAQTDRRIIASVAKAAGTRAGAVSALATTAATTAPQWIPALVEVLTRFGG